MLDFLPQDNVIRRCTILCLMKACIQWQRTRPPPYAKAALGRVERVFDDRVLHGLKTVGTVQKPSVWLKWFVLAQEDIMACFSVCTIITSLRGENADEISGQLSHQEQTVGHHLHKDAVLTEKL